MDDQHGSYNGNFNCKEDIYELSQRLLNSRLSNPYHNRQRAVPADTSSSISSVSSQLSQLLLQPPTQLLQDSEITSLLRSRIMDQATTQFGQTITYNQRPTTITTSPLFGHASSSSSSTSSSSCYSASSSGTKNGIYSYDQSYQDSFSTRYNSRPIPNHYNPKINDDGHSMLSGENYYQNSQYYGNGISDSGSRSRIQSRLSSYSTNYPRRQRQDQDQECCSSPMKLTSLNQIRGRIALAAREHGPCLFLRERLSKGDPEEIEAIFCEARAEICSLSIHQFGRLLVQKLINVVGKNKLEDILVIITDNMYNLRTICTHAHGNKVMLELVERLVEENNYHQTFLMLNLSEIAVALIKSSNCRLFLESCLSKFPYASLEPFLHEIAENFMDIAQDQEGCRVVQKCILICFEQISTDRSVFNSYVSDVIKNAHSLSENIYGNYVVQHVIALEDPELIRDIARVLKGQFVSLSMTKHGSHVVEKLIGNSESHVAEEIIVEIIRTPNLLQLFQDHFGNYVAQTILNTAQEKNLEVYVPMMNFIEANISSLENDPKGRNVLRCVVRRRGSNKQSMLNRRSNNS